ncbi:MAG TPA: tetraacyldisaccharide 4'-kinase [Drouetiella sp.]
MSWGNPTTPFDKLRKTVLTPASFAYFVGSLARLEGYRVGMLKREQADVPVISIGNITCGGTGKTPVTIDLAQKFIAAGLKVGILSRGYKRKSKERTVVVSDGAGNFADCESAGDEPYLIAKRLPKAVVLVGSNRRASAALAVSHYGCEILLLDDGFQHFPIRRDLDIVLIDYNDEPKRDSLLPSGRLREPLSALSRASSLVITKIPENPDQEKIQRLEQTLREHAGDKPVDKCTFEASNLVSPNSVVLPVSAMNGNKVIAVSALARPESFVSMLTQRGADVVKTMTFQDHHWYSAEDLDSIEAAITNGTMVITTEKDLVKMKPSEKLAERLYALRIDTKWIDSPPAVLDEYVNQVKSAVEKQKK